MTVLALLTALAALQIADWWTTRRGLASGKETERGPIMKWAIPRVGLGAALGFKGGATMLAALAVAFLCPPPWPVALLGLWTAIYVAVVGHNFWVLRRDNLL